MTHSLVIGGRVLMLLAAAGAAALAVAVSRNRSPAADGGPPAMASHVCPMHPAVVASGPAACPICGMALERVRTRESDSPRRGVFAAVKRRALVAGVDGPAWTDGSDRLTALLYRDELAAFRSSTQPALFFRAASPSAGIPVRVTGELPEARQSSTISVHLRFDAPAPALRPREMGWIALPPAAREALTVPTSAVLQGTDGPYVLVARDEDRHALERQRVELGRIAGGEARVLSGLAEGDLVAVGGAFWLDAELTLAAERSSAEGGRR
jgi:hypothetical protein